MKGFLLLCSAAMLGVQFSFAGEGGYKDPQTPIEKRIDDLISKMTLEEKVDMVGGTGFATKPNTRLGIPELKMTDGPVEVPLGEPQRHFLRVSCSPLPGIRRWQEGTDGRFLRK